MESFKDRSVSITLTEEYAREVGGGLDDFEQRLEQCAEVVENSINGVIQIRKDRKIHGWDVTCIHGRNADIDVIMRSLQDLQYKTFKAFDRD